tara:strand:- start:21 stop:497 length:477 start_codon:yes stop_codon:yes gene_type:complete
MTSLKELRLELNLKMSIDLFMWKKNIILYLVLSLFLTGCLQTTAMIGPAITLASTGNISQAGMTFFTNKAIKDETGMNALEFVSNKIDEGKKIKNKAIKDETGMNTLEFASNKIDEGKNKKQVDDNFNINNNFIILVKNNFDKTRKRILIQNQSKTFN